MSGRGLIVTIFQNIINSFKFRESKNVAKFMGQDPFGNKYFEIPAEPQLGKRRPKRWYTAASTPKNYGDNHEGFDSCLPAEWESWLRHRREGAPTEQQVRESLAIAEIKKINAAKLEEKRIEEMTREGLYVGDPKPQDHEKPFWPKRDEYEIIPGESESEVKDRWKEYKNPYLRSKN